MQKIIAAVFLMCGILVSMAPAVQAQQTEPAAPATPAEQVAPATPAAEVAPAAESVPAAMAAPPAPKAPAKASKFRLGLGANYFTAIKDLDGENFDENGLSGLVTFQYVPNYFFKIEVDLELRPKGFNGSTESVWLPQTYLLLGNFIYAGAGIGMYYTDGGFQSEPFFAFRGGIDIPLGPVDLDINANYRFEGSLDTEDVNSDTVFLGVAIRYGF